jgi:hypothetical protein
MRDHHPYTIKAARFLPPPARFSAQEKRFSLSKVCLKKAALLLGCFKIKRLSK